MRDEKRCNPVEELLANDATNARMEIEQ